MTVDSTVYKKRIEVDIEVPREVTAGSRWRIQSSIITYDVMLTPRSHGSFPIGFHGLLGDHVCVCVPVLTR
jgi:hypothetical protein